MSTPPRRRRPGARRPKPDAGGWLPTIAMGLGVIVAGLGIGALVAVLMQRHTAKLPPATAVTSVPAPRIVARLPVAITTIVPQRREALTAKPSALQSPSPPPSPEASPTTTSTPAQAASVTTVPPAVPAAKPRPAAPSAAAPVRAVAAVPRIVASSLR